MKRGALDLSVKAFFGMAIVIISIMIMIMLIKQRSESQVVKYTFDAKEDINSFILMFLSSPKCFTYGEFNNASISDPVQGLLDYRKFKNFTKNSDFTCVQNYDFLYSFEFKDIKGWNYELGLNSTINLDSKSIILPLNVAVRYNTTKNKGFIYPAKATFRIYQGEIPSFYGSIKNLCDRGGENSNKLMLKRKISYNDSQNQFCYGTDCFYAAFSCNVKSFDIDLGEKIIYASAKDLPTGRQVEVAA